MLKSSRLRFNFFFFLTRVLQGLRLHDWEEPLERQSMSDIQELEINTYWPCSSSTWLPEGLHNSTGITRRSWLNQNSCNSCHQLLMSTGQAFSEQTFSVKNCHFFQPHNLVTGFVLVTELKFIEAFFFFFFPLVELYKIQGDCVEL